MNERIADIWVYLSTSPLLWLTLTLLAYLAAQAIYQRGGQHPLLNPVAIAVALLVTLLKLTDTSYDTFFDGAQFVHFLLGPATVALAIPLYQQLPRLRRLLLPLMIVLPLGVLVGAASAMWLADALGASDALILSLGPKSTTAPVAMGIAEKIGGVPTLTAVLVVITGIIGAVFGPGLLKLIGVRDPVATGVALGVTSHGIGTARAFQLSPTIGAFSGLAMALAAGLNAVLVPLVVRLLT